MDPTIDAIISRIETKFARHCHSFWKTDGQVCNKIATRTGFAPSMSDAALTNPTLDLGPREQSKAARACETVSINGAKVRVTPVFYAYWRFAAERQSIFYRRLSRTVGALTDDPVLRSFKFTNAYRASDRVSQYLIRNVIYRDDLPDDETNLFFRILLFKLFNKIETWI